MYRKDSCAVLDVFFFAVYCARIMIRVDCFVRIKKGLERKSENNTGGRQTPPLRSEGRRGKRLVIGYEVRCRFKRWMNASLPRTWWMVDGGQRINSRGKNAGRCFLTPFRCHRSPRARAVSPLRSLRRGGSSTAGSPGSQPQGSAPGPSATGRRAAQARRTTARRR